MVKKSARIPPKLTYHELVALQAQQRQIKSECEIWMDLERTKQDPTHVPTIFHELTPRNVVIDNVYYINEGSAIPFGSPIWVGYAGSPVHLRWPYTLISARNWFSTVGYCNEVEITFKGS